jgi:hypothetical protein
VLFVFFVVAKTNCHDSNHEEHEDEEKAMHGQFDIRNS